LTLHVLSGVNAMPERKGSLMEGSCDRTCNFAKGSLIEGSSDRTCIFAMCTVIESRVGDPTSLIW
jgi:hypothetical protein